ncbi:MAG: hypothetical protein DRI97_01220 [Bacteroidetes bacterium]|nr:MAG: hypothetical protein DRI97_01220 [Bacteroidota bacterium]
MRNEDIIPIGGLNTDDDPRHFEKGDYEEMRNLRSGVTQQQGDEGLISSIKSSLDLYLPNMGSSTSEWLHLGVALDEENDRAYLLVYGEVSSIGQFVIYKHNILDNTFKIIFQGLADDWNIKAWDADMQKCYNPRIVDGRLIFTDNVNDIRQIDVEKMETTWDAGIHKVVVYYDYGYAQGVGYNVGDIVYYQDYVYDILQNTQYQGDYPPNAPAYYDPIATVVDVYLDPIDPNNFTLAALPPLISPLAQYMPTPSVAVNQLKGRTWQFSYQYVYMDYRRSTYAPPSLVPAPSQEEGINGKPETDPSHNNTIRLQINTGNEQVRSIRVVARTSEDPSTWFVIDEIYVVNDKDYRVRAAGINMYVYFYNDKSGQVIPSVDVFNLFHYVPIRAKHMELIEGNRLSFAHITEGYSRIGVDAEIELAWQDLSAITLQTVWLNVHPVMRWVGPADDWEHLLQFTIPSSNPGACTFKIRMKFSAIDTWHYINYIYNGTDAYPSTVKTGIQNAINTSYPGAVDTCFASPPSGYILCAWFFEGPHAPLPYETWSYEFYYEALINKIDKYPQLKTGATHAWAVIYRDIVGRITPLNGVTEMTKYIPFPTESTDSNVGRRPEITFKLSHLPPPQAASYEIVYAGNKSTSWHLQLLGYNFAYGKEGDNHEIAGSPATSSDYFRIRVKKPQELTRDSLLNWSVEEYVWEKGDRIRIMGKVNTSGVLTEINDAIYDVEIVAIFDDIENENDIGDGTSAVETTDQWLYFPMNNDITFTPASGSSPNIWPDNLWVEIYRPFVTESNLYFTTGMTFAIGVDVYGNKYHRGDVNQVLNSSGYPLTPASINNTSHDNWKYWRNFRNVFDNADFPIYCESEYASDFYLTNKLTSQGNPIPNIDSQQQNVLTKRLRHGGKVSIGSQLNRLAEFEFDDYKDLKDEHGPIEGLRLVGFVLKVVQYTKVVSIYISRQESFTAAGEAQYLFTDKVFGSVRPAMENWGTRHPDSVITHNRHLYFWDESEAIIVRDAANGPEDVSSKKMRRYFIDKANTLAAYPFQHNVWVQFGFSMATDELFCLFGTGSDTPEIITFSETEQRWKSQIDVSFQRGVMYWFGKRLFQTNSDRIYEWWVGTDYNRITGVPRTPKLVFYGVSDPAKVQIYKAIHAYMTGGRPQFNSITIPEKATAVSGEMETNIYDVNIEEKEGVFYCEILRDINTPGPGTQAEKEMNGREMRGLYIRVDMKVQNAVGITDKVTISNLAVISTPSERSK